MHEDLLKFLCRYVYLFVPHYIKYRYHIILFSFNIIFLSVLWYDIVIGNTYL